MWHARSIQVRLFLVFLFFFLLVLVLGLECLQSLSLVDAAASEIRDRWLPSTRALDDLSNFTTDLPPAADALRRASGDDSRAAVQQRVDIIARNIEVAESAYRKIDHDAAEWRLFHRFDAGWQRYVKDLANDGGAGYRMASNALAALNSMNEAGSESASRSAELVYRQSRRRILVTICLAALLVAVATMYVTRSVSTPLIELANRMRDLARRELHEGVPGSRRRDEIGEMARAVIVFRDNAVDLLKSRQALANQTAVLREKLAAEKEVTLLQRNFVSMASHEFRTPLGIIDGHAQRILNMRERLSPQDLVERVQKIRNSVTRMTQLIENLIGSARHIDGDGTLNFRPVPVDLVQLLREVCQLQRELTPHIPIVEAFEPAVTRVSGDPALLEQLFGNLISNASKYSRGVEPIVVASVSKDGWIETTVTDHGIGIPESDRGRIFQRYYRGSNTTGIVGSGVGLYLVATIAELHGATLEMTSELGSGTRMSVKLPHLAG